ncbi:MAG: hypothetical protein ICV62_17065 [Cyanobacteria bacterium Co-bin13]|nr:hypothetical protein [Cyanobacteria bacterium Co-bin13]
MKKIVKPSPKIPLYEVLTSIGKVDSTEVVEAVQEGVALTLQPLEDSINSLPQTFDLKVQEGVQQGLAGLQPTIASLLEQQTKAQISAVKSLLTPLLDRDEAELDFSDADGCCIQQAFLFMRTLNEIESLIIDSKFRPNDEDENSNNNTLNRYRDSRLYTHCIDILEQKREEGQLTDEDEEALVDAFDALFERMTEDLTERAMRLAELHTFRDRILHFFSDACQTIPEESEPESSIVQ